MTFPGRALPVVALLLVLSGPGPQRGEKELRLDWIDAQTKAVTTPMAERAAAKAPPWVENAVLYEIFVRNFSAEGDFNAVTQRLDDLKDLGVTCLWLMPIHPIGKEKRKGSWGSPYSCVDYYAITPDYGSFRDFRRLVEETHERGMRIILDMVLNHSAWDSPLLEDHPDWYTTDESGRIVSPNSDWTDVADFDYGSSELRDYMTRMLKFWVEEFDVDGFRFDVAELIPLDFWVDVRRELKSIKPDLLMLAEGDDPELHLEAFDLSYSWNVWYHLIEVTNGREPVDSLKATLKNEEVRYPRGSLRMRFVENHDKQRSARVIPGAALKLAHAVIYTLPGIPLLYNGEEVALDRRPHLFSKDPVEWSSGDEEFRRFMAGLGQLKARRDDLSAPEWEFLEEGIPEKVMVWRRGEGTWCLANFQGADQTVPLSPEQLGAGTTIRDIRLVFSVSEGATLDVTPEAVQVRLKPWDLAVVAVSSR